jgi:hypothetical protein
MQRWDNRNCSARDATLAATGPQGGTAMTHCGTAAEVVHMAWHLAQHIEARNQPPFKRVVGI